MRSFSGELISFQYVHPRHHCAWLCAVARFSERDGQAEFRFDDMACAGADMSRSLGGVHFQSTLYLIALHAVNTGNFLVKGLNFVPLKQACMHFARAQHLLTQVTTIE